MNFYYGVMIIFIMLVWGHLIVKFFYRTDISPAKSLEIDGLRGLLALGVFVAHAAISYRYYQGIPWQLPIENFYTMIGEGSVLFFFMITGFLFWNMIIRYRGVLNPWVFVQHRFLRLAPMFIFSFILIQLVAIYFSEYSLYTLAGRSGEYLVHILHFDGISLDITEIPNKLLINASVYWTLEYEWKFYLIILVLAFLYRTVLRHWIWFPLLLLVIIKIVLGQSNIWIIFPFGMLAASIKHALEEKNIIPTRMQKLFFNLFSIPFLVFILSDFHDGFNLLWYALGFLLFLLIVSGYVDFFGLLHLRTTVFLGSISYSVYLLHGIWLYTVLNILKRYIDFKTLGLEAYWLIIAVLGMVMIVSATFTYKFIEEKFYNLRSRMES
ncbi:acyltransferase family protein [Sulfuricurvum sp.]|uniref:acyltransferase family protein n=1 Tax=Sulfuricurvum sp. TaxID=2025608 RepID=UPI0035678829